MNVSVWFQGLSDILAGHLTPRHQQQKYTSKVLLHSALIALQTKGGGQRLREVVRDALHIVFPAGSVKAMMESLEKETGTPSSSLLARTRLVLDISLLIIARESHLIPCSRYAWADASPAKGHEWIWLQTVAILEADLLPVFEAVLRLIMHAQASPEVDLSGEAVEEPILELMSQLHSCVKRHIYTPVALATSCADLSKKAQAVVHAFTLESRDWQGLRATLNSVVSFTSDLGTEIGLAGVQASLRNVSPTWFLPLVQLASDEGEIGSSIGSLPDPGPAQAELDSVTGLFPCCIAVPGVQHVIHNLNSEVQHSLSYWNELHSSLKTVEALLAQPHRKKHFIMSCIQDTCWAGHADAIAKFQATLYQHRWHEMASFVRKLLPLMPTLCGSWDAQKYAKNHAEEGSEFSPQKLSSTLQSELFLAYLHFIDYLESTTEMLAGWAEACDCHDPFVKHNHMTHFEKCVLLKKHFKGLGGHGGGSRSNSEMPPLLFSSELSSSVS